MDLETLLTDPAYDLPVPADGMTRVRLQAGRIRRRRQLVLTVPAVTAVAVLVPFITGGSPDASLRYSHGSATPEPTQSPEPLPTHEPAENQIQTFCLLPEGGHLAGQTDVIGPSGDPLDNCRRFWSYARDEQPPALVAFQDKYNNVVVQAASTPLPEGAHLLPPGFSQSTEAILIDEGLEDTISLGPAHCLTKQEATENIREVIADLGVRGWPIHEDDRYVDPAKQQCWGSAAIPRLHAVVLEAMDGPIDYPDSLEQIARPLRASLTECWSRAKAVAEVHAAVDASSLKQEFKDAVQIQLVDTPSAICTTVHMGGGGGITFTLRGPA